MDRPRDSIAAVVRSRHGPAGGAKFTAWRAPRIVRSHSTLLRNLKERVLKILVMMMMVKYD